MIIPDCRSGRGWSRMIIRSADPAEGVIMYGNYSDTGLNTEETDQVLRFLLHRMGMSTRVALMARLPVAYAKLHPGVSAGVIEDKVHAQVRQYTRAAGTCAGCGEAFPCSDSQRTDIRGDVRATHVRQG